MSTQGYPQAVETARDYYNSDDADNFYFHVWGGEDIHIGLYESPSDDIAAASRRTVERMAARLRLDADSRVLDVGSGYGGAARHLARAFGCHVTALNLSERENERNREMNRAQGLDERIEVVDGSFEAIPLDDASFDVVWSQDAILHSGEREKVIAEIARVLRPGGEFIFTDPMQADDCPAGVLQPVLQRIHLDSLGSMAFYDEVAARHGLERLAFEDMTEQLVRHYSRVREVLTARREELLESVSAEYIDRMLTGLQHWIDAGHQGHLRWGIMHYRKV